jgi:hypothetical protein
MQKAAVLYLTWVGALCGLIVLLLADILPFQPPFATPENFLVCLTEVQLFFVLFCWPRALRTPAPMAFLHVAALILLALPLTLLAANVSNVGVPGLLRGQTLVAAWGVFGSGVSSFGEPRRIKTGPIYVLTIVVLSAILPFWSFLDGGLAQFAWFSPFWAVLPGTEVAAWLQVALFGGAGIALMLFRPCSPVRKVDAPALSG